MSGIIDKITYTSNAVNDIQSALEEKGFEMAGIELMLYGDIIRSIQQGGGGQTSTEETSLLTFNVINAGGKNIIKSNTYEYHSYNQKNLMDLLDEDLIDDKIIDTQNLINIKTNTFRHNQVLDNTELCLLSDDFISIDEEPEQEE